MSDNKQLNTYRYTRFAGGYVTSLTHAKGADLDMLLDVAKPQPNWHVLDVATGGGHTALKFAPFVASVVASDLTPKMLEVAHTFIESNGVNNVTFQIADAENLPFATAQFDLVTCRIAPHHFPNVAKFVKEAFRVIKDDGLLLIQDHVVSEIETVAMFADNFEKQRDPSHHQAYSASEWVSMFQQTGLKVTRTHELTKRHQLIQWATRQGCDAGTIQQLRNSLAQASDDVKAWMQPLMWHTDEASFVNHHIIIAGCKSA